VASDDGVHHWHWSDPFGQVCQAVTFGIEDRYMSNQISAVTPYSVFAELVSETVCLTSGS